MTAAARLWVGLLLACLASAQAPRRHPGAAEGFLPLHCGSTWRWRVTETGPDTAPTIHEEVAWDAGRPMGAAVHTWLVIGRDGGVRRWHWSAGAHGLTAAVAEDAELRRVVVVPAPLGIECNWSWFNFGERHSANEPKARAVHRRGMLVAMREKVQVPAGAFDAAHVRITCWHDDEQVAIDDLWFAAGTGPVKAVRTQANRVITRELLAYTPAPAAVIDVEAALRRQLPRSGDDQAERVAIQWLAPEASLGFLRGHFAAVTVGDGRAAADRSAWFVDDAGRACPIGDDDLAFWRERWHEVMVGPPVRTERGPIARGVDQAAVVGLGAMFGSVRMHRAGLTCSGPQGLSIDSSRDGVTDALLACTVRPSWQCTDCAGGAVSFAAVVRVEGEVLAEVRGDARPKQ